MSTTTMVWQHDSLSSNVISPLKIMVARLECAYDCASEKISLHLFLHGYAMSYDSPATTAWPLELDGSALSSFRLNVGSP